MYVLSYQIHLIRIPYWEETNIPEILNIVTNLVKTLVGEVLYISDEYYKKEKREFFYSKHQIHSMLPIDIPKDEVFNQVLSYKEYYYKTLSSFYQKNTYKATNSVWFLEIKGNSFSNHFNRNIGRNLQKFFRKQ